MLKQTNGKFRFRVFNTGEGIEYHQRFTVGTQELVIPYYELVDISETRLSHIVFLKGFAGAIHTGCLSCHGSLGPIWRYLAHIKR